MLVTLDGEQIEVKSAPVWKLTRGTAPYVLVVEFDRTRGRALFEAGQRFQSVLVFEAEGKTLTIQGLTIIGLSPSSNPNTIKLSVADQRWTWPYRFVARRYNVRRKTPHRRKFARGIGAERQPANLPVDVQNALQQINDDVAYAQWSLKDDGKVFSGADVVNDVMSLVVDPLSAGFRDEDGALSPGLPDVEGLEINSQGDTAVSRALGAMGGGLEVRIDPDGVAVIYSTQSGDEFTEAGFGTGGRPPIIGRPLADLQDNIKTRPKRIEVLFERLIEGRVDFREGDDSVRPGTRTRGDQVVPITAFNVFPMPENGTIPGIEGVRGARTVVQGTWVTLADLLAFYNANPDGNSLAVDKPLSEARIRELWLSNMLNAYAHPFFDKGALWASRIAVIRQHYRATYRINRPWLDRFKDIQNFRVALADPETGARAQSPAFFDYTVIFAFPPSPGENVPPAGESERLLTQLRKAVPLSNQPPGTDIIGTPIEKMNQAPARVSVVDNELGIINVRMASDFSALTDRYLRTGTTALAKPFAYGQRSSLNKQGRLFLLQDEELSEEHEVSIILTFAMGSPNDDRRFFKIIVTPQEAERFLPAIPGPSIPGEGPVLQIRVGAPRAVARHVWNDAIAPQFFRAFAGRQNEDGTDPNIGDPINIDQLTSYAQAVAAKEAARYRNHPEGALHSSFAPEAKVRGTISSVSHEFTADADGGAITAVELLPEPPGLDVSVVLPKDVRRVIEGFVDDPR